MPSSVIPEVTAPSITSDQALRIARLDAERVYRDLSPYRASVVLEENGWHRNQGPAAPRGRPGGGPHYVIDPISGDILSRLYEQ